MNMRTGTDGFPPVFSPSSRVLILGSYPSPKSFEYGFYYGHPQNRFWPLIALLLQAPVPETIPKKRSLLLDNHLALWDSLLRCTIQGAEDSSITSPVPNDIPALIAQSEIQSVVCNGGAAAKYYTQYCEPKTGIPCLKFPSTSPANAAFSLERLAKYWQPLLQLLGR